MAPVKENEGDSLECEGTNEYGSKSAKTKINVVFGKLFVLMPMQICHVKESVFCYIMK